MDGSYLDLSVVIPTLNEAETIIELLRDLCSRYPGISLIIADDGSNDGTQALVEGFTARDGGVRLLDRAQCRVKGITAAVLDAIAAIETKYFVVMDGDLQHPPEVVEEIVSLLRAGNDLVVGVRIPYKENQGLHRIVVTRVAARIARGYLRRRGFDLRDPMSGFFGGRTELFRETARLGGGHFEPRGYKVLFDFVKQFDPLLPWAEVEYHFAFRTGGHSKLRPAHAFYFLRSLFR